MTYRRHQQPTAICPNGLTRAITTTGNVVFEVPCRDCPLRARCTASKTGRTVHEHEALLRAARRQAEKPEFQAGYRPHRPMVERFIAWLTGATGACAIEAPRTTTAGCTTALPASTCAG